MWAVTLADFVTRIPPPPFPFAFTDEQICEKSQADVAGRSWRRVWYDSVQGASRDVELVSWPYMSVGAMHGEGERGPENASVCLVLNSLFHVHRHAGGLPVLLWRGRQPEHGLPCCYSRVICIPAQSWGKKGLADLFLNRKPASYVQIMQYFF